MSLPKPSGSRSHCRPSKVDSRWQLAQPKWFWKAERALKNRRSPRRSDDRVAGPSSESVALTLRDAVSMTEMVSSVRFATYRRFPSGESAKALGSRPDGDPGDHVVRRGREVIGQGAALRGVARADELQHLRDVDHGDAVGPRGRNVGRAFVGRHRDGEAAERSSGRVHRAGPAPTSPATSGPKTEIELPKTQPCSTCASGIRFLGRSCAAIPRRPSADKATRKTPAALGRG